MFQTSIFNSGLNIIVCLFLADDAAENQSPSSPPPKTPQAITSSELESDRQPVVDHLDEQQHRNEEEPSSEKGADEKTTTTNSDAIIDERSSDEGAAPMSQDAQAPVAAVEAVALSERNQEEQDADLKTLDQTTASDIK